MRRAIALIELIFAIVIIGITLLTVPNLLNTTTKATVNAITQEAISNGASHLEMILSQYWDENSINNDNPILYVNNGDSELEEAKDSNGNALSLRVGSNKESPRRFKLDSSGNKIYATSASLLGLESNDTQPDDIDDFAKTSYTLVKNDEATVDIGEYKDKTIKISTSVYYISDSTNYSTSTVTYNNPLNNPNAQSTNIKAIKVTITSTNDNKFIVLNGFSCNIGAQKLRRRDF